MYNMVKIGLGQSYDRTIVPKKIRAYVDLTKPASSIGVMLAVPFAAIIYAELHGLGATAFILNNWQSVLYASVTLFLLHGGSQTFNHVEDAEIDAHTQHKSSRPIPSGVVTKEEGRSLAWIMIFVGVARAFTITPEFGLFAVLLSFMGVFYNLNPIRVKERLWVNLIWQAASRGLLLYPATFAVWGEIWNPFAWTMGFASFLLVLAMQNTADFSDVKVDAEFGITTPAVHHGLDELTKIMSGIVLVMFGYLSLVMGLDIIPDLWLLYLLIIPLGWSLYSLWTEPRGISDIGGNHTSWYIFYLSLASLYILPAIQLLLV